MKIPFGFGCLLADEIFKDTHTHKQQKENTNRHLLLLLFLLQKASARA